MATWSSSMRSCWTSIASSSKAQSRILSFHKKTGGCSELHGTSSSAKSFSTSVSRPRNTPVRRPRDPLDSSPDAIRHRLPTGETFIVRPPPTAPTPYNLGPSHTTVAYASAPNSSLPPALRPTSRLLNKGQNDRLLSSDEIAMIQSLRKQDPIRYTISRLAQKYKCSPSIIKIAAPLSANVRRLKEAEVEMRRANWGANKTLQRELRKERKALW